MPAEAFFALIAMAVVFGGFAAALAGVLWYTRDVRATFPRA